MIILHFFIIPTRNPSFPNFPQNCFLFLLNKIQLSQKHEFFFFQEEIKRKKGLEKISK